MSLIWTSTHVDAAFKNFFKSCKDRKSGLKNDGGKPKFKKRRYDGSYTTYQGVQVLWDKNEIKIPKLKTHIKSVLHRKFTGTIKQATLSYNNANQYFISILVEDGLEAPKEKEVAYETVKGIDLGLKNSVVTSDGVAYDSFSNNKKEDSKLKRLHKLLSRKEKHSKNFEKARLRLAKLNSKINNKKLNKIDNITHDLTHNDNTSAICLENLNVKGMQKNHNLSKKIAESSWNAIKTKLKYKGKWNGIKVVEINRFYPSSQTCSKCGYVNNIIKNFKIREWVCPKCGEIHNRDINAAINIKNEGYKIITEAKQ